jgi:hypothetical protein
VTVDGRELPCPVDHDGRPGPTVLAGSLTLNKDATFIVSFSFAAPNGQTMNNEGILWVFKK